MKYYFKRFDQISKFNATEIEGNIDALSAVELQRIAPTGKTLREFKNELQRGEVFLLCDSPDSPLFAMVNGELTATCTHSGSLPEDTVALVLKRLIASKTEGVGTVTYDNGDSLEPAIEPEELTPEPEAPVRNAPKECYSYHLEIACPPEKRTKYAPGYFNLAEVKDEEAGLVLKQHPSIQDKAWLYTKASSGKKRKLYYKPQSGRGSNLFACDVELVGEKELKANEALIPVTPAIQVGERLGFPTEGYFYHFYEKKLIQELKITDNKKECVFAVTRSYLDTLSDEVVIKQTHHHILVYWRLHGSTVTDQHLVYLKQKITAEELQASKSGSWLEEHGVKIDVEKLLSALEDKIIERPPSETYEVQSGDSLSKIAKKNNITLDELREVNPKFLQTSLIQVGEKLKLPDASKDKPVENPKTYQRQENACYELDTDVVVPTVLAFQEKFIDKNCAVVNVRSLTLCKNCGKEGECKLDIDYAFIQEQEGALRTDGYMPDVPDDENDSGVTISTGVDLGARNLNDLTRLGLEPTLIRKLSPYLGKKLGVARTYLAKHPLKISSKEAKALYKAVKKESTALLLKNYNRDSKNSLHFYCLPREAQTVVASLYYQYQGKLIKYNAWRQMCKQDWKELHKNLLNFGDAYPSRRKREAAVLKRLL